MGWISDLAGSLCCVLGQNTLLSKCSSLLGVEMGIGLYPERGRVGGGGESNSAFSFFILWEPG